ncbi:MAG: hypothetical protein ABJB12_15005 [Pseudomonadota bacterium]
MKPSLTVSPTIWPCLRALACALALASCDEQLDAGSSRPHGVLPFDERSPVILLNDGAYDNWDGEYALLLANGGGSKLAAIIVSTGGVWSDINANVAGFRGLVNAARQSGLQDLPDPTTSVNSRLAMPPSGKVEDTQPNRSEGARLIVSLSEQLALPYRPVVIATGGSLTDVADAYLIDPSVVDRVVVVSSLGALNAAGAMMAMPNGEIDPWADLIVASRFRYVQVSAFYDQLADVPDSRVSELPANALGAWMRAKQPKISQNPVASDQVSLLAASLPGFVIATRSASVTLPFTPGSNAGPALTLQASGTALLVTQSAGALASARLWQLLLTPATFSR